MFNFLLDAASHPEIEAMQQNYMHIFTKVAFSLFTIIVVVFAALWVYRRFSSQGLRQSNQMRAIKILEKRAISPKTALYLIEIAGKQILIAESQLEIRPIHTVHQLGEE